ncbi:MAG: recombination regulator RecX [Candidatus Peribacteraceae bacterium]|nr:recombination regulator RecX [Candidatus Peribacteraceae bacterium]
MRFKYKKKPKQADERQVFQYACWLLARRNYSRAELLEKFEKKYIPDAAVFAKVFAKLTKLNLQSDESFTEGFVRAHTHWGARRISIELKRRGIDEELIEINLPTEISEIENAREVLARKLHTSTSSVQAGEKIPSEYSEKQKLAAFLARRGFSIDVIREVLGF